ncbi:MAG: hypothetical protein IT328_27830 [Caldilineaceae bacterium]|nr:hypothetical protein [Caldilineaceae bacterium]
MAANDKMNQWIRNAAGRGQPVEPAQDPTAPPARPPTYAGNGAGMVTPVKKVLTPAQQMNNLIRGIR